MKNKIKKIQKENHKKKSNVLPNSNSKRDTKIKNNKSEKIHEVKSTMTISDIKNSGGEKFNSIKVSKSKRNINPKNKRNDINNNININININSNHIFNSNSQINNTKNHNTSNSINNSINSNIINKKKYNDLIKQTSTCASKRNVAYHQKLKKVILTASNNNIFNNSKKNYIYDEITKKKNSVLVTSNTLTFSGYLTSRNSQNSSKIKYSGKNEPNNFIGKGKIRGFKDKKNLFSKIEKVIHSKNKIPTVKSQKTKKTLQK